MASLTRSTAIITVDEAFVLAFARAGWIMADGPDRFVLADAGRAFLVRSLGGEDVFAAQHRVMQTRISGEPDGGVVRINAAESPLTRLRHRDLLDPTQFAAGEKLRRDFTLGQLSPRMGVDWSAPVVSGARGAAPDTVSDIAIAARQRFSRAIVAVGPGLGDLLFDVCCHLTTLEDAEARRGWARRSGRVVLKIALDRLGAHYGLTITRRGGGIRAWAMDEAL